MGQVNDKLDEVSELGAVAKATNDVIALFSKLTDHFKNYKPELRVVNFDYTDLTWEAKYFLIIQDDWKRRTKRKVEVPAFLGASVTEVIAGDTMMPVKVNFDRKDQKWIVKANDFPNSENFLFTLQGNVPRSFFDDWVELRVSADSTGGREVDKYWVHAALTNASVLQEIHDEFNVERVRSDVKVGVERIFSTTVPERLKKRLLAQKELMEALESKSRNVAQLRAKYRHTVKTSRSNPMEILAFLSDLVSGDYFRDFVEVDQPFQMGEISPDGVVETLPERVQVEVFTRLNLDEPVVEGSLIFKKSEYIKSIDTQFEEFMLAEKSKKVKKTKE
jgi:hypothetical protein